MPEPQNSHAPEPSRDEIDHTPGAVVVEIGASWCGHCQGLRPHVDAAVQQHKHIRHIKIEDGKGRPLGRTFGVKLWPTLVFMRDGQILEQLVRPSPEELRDAFERLSAAAR